MIFFIILYISFLRFAAWRPPSMSVRLYVGNLPEDVDREVIDNAFTEAGTPAAIKLITDRKTNKCRGFGFVTVKTDEEADQFIEKFNGLAIGEISLKIEKALPRAKGDEAGDAAPVAAPSGGGGNSKARTQNKGGGGGNKGGGGNNNNAKRGSNELEAMQPDPRWASALEQLKQQLAATSS
jgi:RNA recognition motif-containing protein